MRLASYVKSGVSLQEGDRLYRDFDEAYQQLSTSINLVKDPTLSTRATSGALQRLLNVRDRYGVERTLKMMNKAAIPLINVGHNLAKFILEHKVVPRGKAKNLEKIAKVFLSARRAPRKVDTWLQKNSPGIHIMLESQSWPNKEDQPDQDDIQFGVGPFTVHNVVGLEGSKLESTRKTIESALNFLKKSKVPRVQGVLYGPVMVVGQLSQPRTLAWYYPSDDTVYMRPHLKLSRSDVHNLIHELGHRYWAKFANREKKAQWVRHHRDMKNQGEGERITEEEIAQLDDVQALEGLREGDVFPIKIKGMVRGGAPRIEEIIEFGTKKIYVLKNSKGSSENLQAIHRRIRGEECSRSEAKRKFPYSVCIDGPRGAFLRSVCHARHG